MPQKVFITGAAGFIGSAVTAELISHGYEVLGLARSDSAAETVTKNGGKPHKGDLEDLESLKSGAAASDGVIHLAFVHDFSNLDRVCNIDQAAIKAMGEGLAGSNKPLIVVSGTLGFPKGQLATEDTEIERGTPLSKRGESQDLVKQLSKDIGIRGMAINLTPTVHGRGDKGFVPTLIDAAKKNGYATYIGDGSNVWPAGHRLDAAVLLRLAFEKGRAGAVYNAVAEQGVSHKDIAEVISKRLGIPAESKKPEEAMQTLGFLGAVIGLNNPTSGEKTQKELGWEPKQIGLLQDMEENYFIPGAGSKYVQGL
ncbi:hypothetical protein M409DRAFT_57284 [Zasmidium cellare ATCC 36951]|uniref:NAD-dependent epimerase/dehydratase domain-containing protein n=1 Tax=Zasmidium cellare ATCC 36951 TaxID=1080233 RepID=A0A6A6C9V5_ZASCE|nr:uncharacterized protein M409DRAFT_57284 [Zasmidium cellare ATCC 36951]KAF2163805.1 hypothetical protein M409DRAFT_57284 [Zasmidium cellare ATCC 36951]